MATSRIKRIYTTKINDLVKRDIIYNHEYPYEFMNKMSEKEIKTYLWEVKKQIHNAGITTNNINHYNRVVRNLIIERESIYQSFKENFVEDYIIIE